MSNRLSTAHLQKYVKYIDNTGGVTPDQFDVDWEPIGPIVREDLTKSGMVEVKDGQLVRTGK